MGKQLEPDFAAVLKLVLPPRQAAQMFTRLAPRAAAGPAGEAEAVEVCGWRGGCRWTLADLIAEIRVGLLTLAAENASIAAAFDVSYRHLDLACREFLCLLGLHPGTTIDGTARPRSRAPA